MPAGIRTIGLREVAAQVREAERLMGSPEPIMKGFQVVVLRKIDEIFRVGGLPKWKPLAPSTVSAKRQGNSKSGRGAGLPLQGLRDSWDSRIQGKRLEAFSRRPESVFHEFGTKGPYEIRPRPGTKALALPAFGRQTEGKPGRFTLEGLQRSRKRKGSGFVFQPAPGRGSGRFAGREGKRVAPYSAIEFFKKVTHPGLVERRMTPTEEQIIPDLVKTAEFFVTRALRGQ